MVFDFLSRLTGVGNPVAAVAEQVGNIVNPMEAVAEHVGNLGDNATNFVEGIPGVDGLSETLGGLTEHVNNLGGSVTEQLSSFFKFGE
ncbi:hypothetical protein [Actinotignum urinale]|uniref:hypothetical protein n=1 Tax=Actinotignum urinale TaxID=190146 RepID=UPI00280B3C47|nr:hypothetical protein [Actinotignum urinale]